MAINYPQRYDDDFLNTIKTVIDHVNIHGKTIQDLVAEGQLTEEQYAELVTVINGHLKSGDVDKFDLSPMLQKEIDRVNAMRVNTNDRPIDVDEMNTRTKQLFTGGAVAVVGENAVGRENIKRRNVELEHLSILSNTDNLFDGAYNIGFMNSSGAYRSDGVNGRIAIVEVTPGQTYTIKDHQPVYGRFFIVAGMKESPNFTETYQPPDTFYVDNGGLTEYTLTTEEDIRYLLIYVGGLATNNFEPHLKVEEGDTATPFTGYPVISKKFVEKPDIETADLPNVPADKLGVILDGADRSNLFDGDYKEGEYVKTNVTPRVYSTLQGTVSIVVPVSPSTTYYIKKFDDSDRFRIFTFNSEPKIGDEISRRINNDMSLSEYELTTTGNENYIVVQVSSRDEKPRITVTADGFPDEFIEPPKIREYLLPEFESKREEKKYFITGDFSKYYQVPDDDYNLSQSKSSDAVYQDYDDLLTQYPDLITRNHLGYANDEEGNQDENYPIYEYVMEVAQTRQLTHRGHRSELGESPKILIVTGVHGDEKATVHALYRFVEKLLNSPNTTPLLTALKSNFTFKIIPLVNPWGYDNSRRTNARGVNINRNFSYNWAHLNGEGGSEPYSEIETQILGQWFEENKDAKMFIDYHNFWTGTRVEGVSSYHFSPNRDLDKMYDSLIRVASTYWHDRYYSSLDFGNIAYGFDNSDYYRGTSTTINEAYNEYGIELSATPETIINDIITGDSNTQAVIENTTELLINYIASTVDHFIK